MLDIGISKVSIHRNLGGKLSLVYRYVEFSISYNDRPFIHSKIKSSSYLHAGISCVLDIVSKFRYIGISFFSTHGHGGKGLVLDIGTGEKNGISENKKTIYRNIEKDDIPIWGGREASVGYRDIESFDTSKCRDKIIPGVYIDMLNSAVISPWAIPSFKKSVNSTYQGRP